MSEIRSLDSPATRRVLTRRRARGRGAVATTLRASEVVVTYGLLLALGFLFLLPFFWMATTAFKPQALVTRFPPEWLTTDWTLANFRVGWNALPFGRFLVNSAIITVLTVVGTVLSSSLAGFGFARYRARGAGVLFIVLLLTMMAPPSTTLIPRYVMFTKIGWVDSWLPLIVPAMFGNPFHVFLFRQFFRSIPREYFDAAAVDGCTPLGLYWRIALPMATPAVAASALFAALTAWNDFLDPLVFVSSLDKFTLQLGLSSFQGQYFNQVHLMMPMALVGVVPALILVIIGQRWIARGLLQHTER